MLNNYEEKKQRRIENYKKLSKKTDEKSKEAYQGAKNIIKNIPFGQPILVGHHSENRHRKDLKRIDSLMMKSIEEKEKSEYYKRKICNMENETKIYSDDPNAIAKLKEKLNKRIGLQEYMKETNKNAKKESKDKVFQMYQLQNNNQNITRIKKRIETLEKKCNEETKIIYENEDVKIVDNVEANRLQIYFIDIPDVEVRTKLKKNGFRWSRYNECWQRFRLEYAIYIAKKILDIKE